MLFNIKRFITFFIGLPAILAMLIIQELQLMFVALIIVTTVISGFEVKAFFTRNTTMNLVKGIELIVLSSCFPIIATLNLYIDFEQNTYLLILVAMCMYLFIRSILSFRESPNIPTLYSLGSRILVLLYPGLFSYFLITLTTIPNANVQLPTFVLAVYCGDAAAYLVGKLWTRRSKKTPPPLIPVSPRKTIAGFVASILSGMIIYGLAPILMPERLPFSWPLGICIGAIIGFGGIIGDLAESYLKRIAHKKNSGNLIPGRGGILDSYDSVCFAAPIAYFIFTLL